MKSNSVPIRIQDVARAAGVSVSTVSRVLNGRDDVAADTVQRVQRIIDDLGYSSSLAAKSMRSQRTNVIGVIIFDLSLSFCLEVVRGIDQAVKAHTYDLMIFSSNRANHRDDPTWEHKVVAQLNGSIVDGIIAVTPTTVDLPTNSPLVTIDPVDGGNFPSVLSTNHEGTLEAVRYLIDLGHRCIGFIGGRPSLLSARQRQQGYADAHKQAGLPILPELYFEGDYSRDVALIGARRLLTLPERPSAIMAANDQSAFAVLEVADELQIAVPQDLSLIGFDNTPESAYTSPPLTTVDQSIVAMGSRAAELLIQMVEGRAVENDLYQLPTRLVVRGSCVRAQG
ncbi:MAG: LacI family DNA-binding transcriptional regulator [Caldilineaceae bacterium]|nr:LacI family DNA-binding transcriptional regulator [Caldilineaceae bacterium]